MITEPLYEANTVARAENGSNRWYNSDIRAWCNNVQAFVYREVVDDYMQAIEAKTGEHAATPFDYIAALDYDLSNAIKETTCTTAKSAIDSVGIDTTFDWFFLPSLTELTGNRNGNYIEGTQFRLFSTKIDEPYLTMTRSAYQSTVSQDAGIHIQAINNNGNIVTSYAKNLNNCYIAFSIG